MKKELIAVIILMIFLVSCTNDTGSTGPSNKNWRSGSEALRMSFVSDNPPSEILSTQELSVMVEYSNRGAYDIGVSNLKFYLTGYDSSILFNNPIQQSSSSVTLEGKDPYNSQGSQTAYAQWKSSVDLNGIADVDSFRQDLTVTACYNYRTIATPLVCVDPKKYDLVVSSRCTFDIQDLGSNQGGPIAVSSIKKRTTRDKVYFEIYIKNVGNGIPFVKSIDNCHNSLGIRDINQVKLEKISLSKKDFTSSCKPSTTIHLDNGQGYFVCERDMPENSFFNGVMEIELSYGYRETMSRSLNIVNIDR